MGTPSGITDASIRQCGTKRAGYSPGPMSALLAKRSPSPKLTKWLRNAVSVPLASSPAVKRWKPPGR